MNPNALRPDFPILNQTLHGKYPLIYFDNAASTQRPTVVLEAMDECYKTFYSNVHRGIHHLSEVSSAAYEQSRLTLQNFLGANDPAEIIFTSGTTAAVNLVARSWSSVNLHRGDEILLTIFEHHSNIVPWQQAAVAAGAQVIFCPLGQDGRFDLDLWKSHFTPATKLASFAAISNVLGDSLPIIDMIRFAKRHGATTFVDAAQLVPHEPVDVNEWGADFIAFSGHKMLGPTGIGILYGKRDQLESMPPFLGGGSMINTVTTAGFTPGELPAKFEAGTPPIAEAIGLAAAAKYLAQIGLESIAEHERKLGRLLRNEIAAIDGAQFLSANVEPESGIIAFHFHDLSAQDVALLLDRKGVAVRAGHHCAMPLHDAKKIPASLRASLYLYNTSEEVEQFGEHLKTVVAKLRA